jgi:hypothetical protein
MERCKTWLWPIAIGAVALAIVLRLTIWREAQPGFRHSVDQRASQRSDGRHSSGPENPLGEQRRILSTWHEWCAKEQQWKESGPPLCAMYRMRSWDEPLAEVLNQNWNLSIPEDRTHFESALKEKRAQWKRVELMVAVWPNSRVFRSPKFRQERDLRDTNVVKSSQISDFVRSLETLDLAGRPFSGGQYLYIDVGYWVIEISRGTEEVHMASWTQHPDAKEGDAEFRRFCAVWKCAFRWLHSLEPAKHVSVERGFPTIVASEMLRAGRSQP